MKSVGVMGLYTRPLEEGNWQLMAVGGGSHFRVTFLQGCDLLIGCSCHIGRFNTFADISSTNMTWGNHKKEDMKTGKIAMIKINYIYDITKELSIFSFFSVFLREGFSV